MDLRYPIGRFTFEGDPSSDDIFKWIAEIENAPSILRETIKDLSDEQLDTPYRPDGWTIRQVVHHLADSHMNSYIRFKLALTENNPTIKPYHEDKWAELPDSDLPIEISLLLLDALHKRWVVLLRSLSSTDLQRPFIHPDSGVTKIDITIGNYAWHSNHHIAHISSLCKRLGW